MSTPSTSTYPRPIPSRSTQRTPRAVNDLIAHLVKAVHTHVGSMYPEFFQSPDASMRQTRANTAHMIITEYATRSVHALDSSIVFAFSRVQYAQQSPGAAPVSTSVLDVLNTLARTVAFDVVCSLKSSVVSSAGRASMEQKNSALLNTVGARALPAASETLFKRFGVHNIGSVVRQPGELSVDPRVARKHLMPTLVPNGFVGSRYK